MGWFYGAAAGLILGGGPLGAIVGGVLQHMVTKPNKGLDRNNHKEEAIFVSNLVAIITKVAMADKRVTQTEVDTIHRFFEKTLGYRGNDIEFIDRLIQETINQNPPLESLCTEFLHYSNNETRMLLLNILYQVANADYNITQEEQTQIDRIAILLHIPEHINVKIKNTYNRSRSSSRTESKQPKAKTPYDILGVDKTATNDEIKKAYRTLAMQYHPDKVSHLGNELIDFAKNKFTEINTAYNEIKKMRGI